MSVFHVDLDAFFASVEVLDHPEYRGRPIIVGARPGSRGVVSTASYEARAFGVHSAMPISEAFRRCPDGLFLPVRMERYAELSRKVMSIFESFTPDFHQVSIDEAFLDMGGTEKLWGRPEEAALKLKAKVRAETGLGISVGIASNHYVAKIASGLRKPDGLVIVEEGKEGEFMLSLPLGKLWGAGEKTQERFSELGIRTIAQIAAMSENQLSSLFGKAGGAYLYAAVRGREMPGLGAEAESRSMSSERTFEYDLSDRDTIGTVLMSLADEVYYRLWLSRLNSRCLFLKLRLSDFTTFSRRHSRREAYRSAAEAYADSLDLLASAWDGSSPVRLLGLGFADLESAELPLQGELFDSGEEKKRKAEKAVFEIERKGIGELKRARLMGPGGDRASGREGKRKPD